MLLLKPIPQPPVQEFKSYHKVISEAYHLKAYHHSGKLFTNAILFSSKAYEKWQNENEQWILKRDYSEIKTLVHLALSTAEVKPEAVSFK